MTMATIPFSFLPRNVLLKLSDYLMGTGSILSRAFLYLQLELDRANFKVEAKRYVAMCLAATIFLFIIVSAVLTLFLLKLGLYYAGILIAFVFSSLVFFMQMGYPKLVAQRRIRKLDADLLAALRAIMIQLNSGVPLFEAMVIISHQQFGEVSQEFKKAVKKMSAGVSQIAALETLALQNPSPYFRRTIWQIINAVKEGAAINEVMTTVITNLTKEQIIQIEKYGSQLNPLAMFYMMGAVILPVLGVTFLIVLASFIAFDEMLIKILFIGILGLVIFFQIMFTGIIKTRRPSLLGE